jgi:hypothetical protein
MAAATTIDTYPLIARPENLVPLSILRSVKIEVSPVFVPSAKYIKNEQKE